MFTIKQMEALYWVANLGTFEAAADYLNLTQSTVSKRIGELEGHFSTPLFDRTSRKAALTSTGRDVCEIAEEILKLNNSLIEIAKAQAGAPRRFRLGVTDLIAYSWLPELLQRISDRYPGMTLEPEVELTSDLLSRLAESKIDFIVCPRASHHPLVTSLPLGSIEMAWMCHPKLGLQGRLISKEELTQHRILIQSRGSVLRPMLKDIIDNPKLKFKSTVNSNNMAALAELAANGLGVTVLPSAFFRRYVDEGRLCVIKTSIEIPPLEYFVSYREDYNAQFLKEVTRLCEAVSTF
ncbi:LysR family transcriptional regulator [Roseibium sp.]